jgi:hypothetical protein
MMAMVTGFWVTQTVRAAALYNLADHLAAGTDTAEAIAGAESTDPDATRRLLRTCASLGLMTSGRTSLHRHTPAEHTPAGRPHSLRHFAISQSAPGHWLPWGRFPEAVRTGRHQVTAAHGEANIFDYFAKHLDEASSFTESMSNLSRASALDIAAVLDTKGVTLALDIGGAGGDVVRAMMRANPELDGGVFDLPHIVPAAAEAAKAEGLDGRFTTVGGDFFESVPPADLYVLKYILHDWDDAELRPHPSKLPGTPGGGRPHRRRRPPRRRCRPARARTPDGYEHARHDRRQGTSTHRIRRPVHRGRPEPRQSDSGRSVRRHRSPRHTVTSSLHRTQEGTNSARKSPSSR